MKRCSYELAPYSGNGFDPPTCGAPAVVEVQGYPYCASCAEQVKKQIIATASNLERTACAVADAWMKERDDFSLTRRMLPEFEGALKSLELSTRDSLLRKVKP